MVYTILANAGGVINRAATKGFGFRAVRTRVTLNGSLNPLATGVFLCRDRSASRCSEPDVRVSNVSRCE